MTEPHPDLVEMDQYLNALVADFNNSLYRMRSSMALILVGGSITTFGIARFYKTLHEAVRQL